MPDPAPPADAGELHFECTQCGQCCHDLKLPLTCQEAIAWLDDGHTVEVLCEAAPWTAAPSGQPWPASHLARRGFGARSGSLPVRVGVTLAAAFAGACPNLSPTQQCTIYGRRPLVCRIYPAEIRPGRPLQPREKACPPPAWDRVHPILVQRGQVVDAALRALIQRSRDEDAAQTPARQQLCAALGLDRAAVAEDGWVVHRPDRAALLAALRLPVGERADEGQWSLWSHRRSKVDELLRRGASSQWAGPSAPPGADYIGLLPVDG